MVGRASDAVHAFARRIWRVITLCVLAVGLSSCKPEPPKMQVDAPFITCAAFDFRVSDREEMKAARRLMFEAAMIVDLPFAAAVPFGNFGFHDVIGGLGYPHRFVLSSEGGPWLDQYWFRVEYLAGGPPQRVPWDHKQPYVPPSKCLEWSVTQFAKVRELFKQKWPITELDVSKPIPMRFRSAAANQPS